MTHFWRGFALIISTVVIASFLLSSCFPLLTYGSGLAIFGIAHVIRELHYVDQRFGARINKSFTISLAIVLLGIICTRTAIVFKIVPHDRGYNVELVLVFLLALLPLLHIPLENTRGRFFAWSLAALIGIGFLISPIATILLLSVAHNLTPMGFIVEIAPAHFRKHALALCMMVFVALPIIIASGVFAPILQNTLGLHYDFSLFPNGPLEKHFAAFLPSSLRSSVWAANAFCAIVFAQCMHYLAVIYVMPKLLNTLMPTDTIKPLFSWPKAPLMWLIIGGATALLAVLYVKDFFWARSVYGIAAAFHAYIEIPLLLWALSFMKTPTTMSEFATLARS